MHTDISEGQMIADGWVKGIDPADFLFQKTLPNRNPINNTPEDSDIKLVVHAMFNEWSFAVALPDGGLLNFIANSMAELKAFENALNFYDPPY